MKLTTSTRPVTIAVSALIALGTLTACGTGEADAAAGPGSTASQEAAGAEEAATRTPSDVLASTAWETTGATDASGEEVALDDEDVRDFVGWAYFAADGTFTMYDLDDGPKMQGDWTVTEDGTTRHIVAKDDAGEVLFERDSDIVTLTDEEFTYRVFPDPEDTEAYVDIVHTPTDHEEPAAS
ncbi:DUF4822 domain-containing protein [Krasilnikoviella flava]|uniref:DUF4822 domain-containing protein n=1 Tax=Krasilnikoviella flava TaxID=526729 RepID=A0A1T5M1J3_9MICO|nr:DUF4822 domain-containing protein [Krasilnikoviella flava]SKC81668.1 protein of unknown function [Krasilnikoviella flava]